MGEEDCVTSLKSLRRRLDDYHDQVYPHFSLPRSVKILTTVVTKTILTVFRFTKYCVKNVFALFLRLVNRSVDSCVRHRSISSPLGTPLRTCALESSLEESHRFVHSKNACVKRSYNQQHWAHDVCNAVWVLQYLYYGYHTQHVKVQRLHHIHSCLSVWLEYTVNCQDQPAHQDRDNLREITFSYIPFYIYDAVNGYEYYRIFLPFTY